MSRRRVPFPGAIALFDEPPEARVYPVSRPTAAGPPIWTRRRALADLRRHLDEVGIRGSADADAPDWEIAAIKRREDL